MKSLKMILLSLVMVYSGTMFCALAAINAVAGNVAPMSVEDSLKRIKEIDQEILNLKIDIEKLESQSFDPISEEAFKNAREKTELHHRIMDLKNEKEELEKGMPEDQKPASDEELRQLIASMKQQESDEELRELIAIERQPEPLTPQKKKAMYEIIKRELELIILDPSIEHSKKSKDLRDLSSYVDLHLGAEYKKQYDAYRAVLMHQAEEDSIKDTSMTSAEKEAEIKKLEAELSKLPEPFSSKATSKTTSQRLDIQAKLSFLKQSLDDDRLSESSANSSFSSSSSSFSSYPDDMNMKEIGSEIAKMKLDIQNINRFIRRS